MNLKRQFQWYVLMTLAFVNAVVWYSVFREEQKSLIVAFLDVGQGDAIFIESPSGNQVLIDGGAGRAVLRELGSVMAFYDRSVDVVIATHPDKDHIGGLADVLELYKVSYILESGVIGDTQTYQTFDRLADEEDAVRMLAMRGQIIDLGEGVFLRVLFPDRDVSGLEPNAGSVIVQVVYGETGFMLTGDAPRAIEQYVVSLDGVSIESEVLKAGHHGSNTSSADVFLGLVEPDYVIISAGENNRYGHPHEEVVNAIERFGASMLTTYEAGTIVFESNGTTVSPRK